MEAALTPNDDGLTFGRYRVYGKLGFGGMAAVYLGRLAGDAGFVRSVAIKKLHPQYASNPETVRMFRDEARLASRINHTNVVSLLDVVADAEELLIVMEYVHGETLAHLLQRCRQQRIQPPPTIVTSVMVGALLGLHAAHTATGDQGKALGIVHRDVSPQNIIVGVDGVSRILDFGVAKAAVRSQVTLNGQVKGKLGYMAPEQWRGAEVDARTDVFAAGIVTWEALTARRLFPSEDIGQLVWRLLESRIPPPSLYCPEVPAALDAVVLKALARAPQARYATAQQFASALERAAAPASATQVGEWVMSLAEAPLSWRQRLLDEIAASAAEPGLEYELDDLVRVDDVPRLPAHEALISDALSVRTVATEHSIQAAPATPLVRHYLAWLSGVGVLLAGCSLAFLVWPHGPRGPFTPTHEPLIAVMRQMPLGRALSALRVSAIVHGNPLSETSLDPASTVDSPAVDSPTREVPRPPALPSTVVAGDSARRDSAPGDSARPRHRAKVDCTPPYSVDAMGVRRINPACL